MQVRGRHLETLGLRPLAPVGLRRHGRGDPPTSRPLFTARLARLGQAMPRGGSTGASSSASSRSSGLAGLRLAAGRRSDRAASHLGGGAGAAPRHPSTEADHSKFFQRFADDPMLGRTLKVLPGKRPIRIGSVTQALVRAVCRPADHVVGGEEDRAPRDPLVVRDRRRLLRPANAGVLRRPSTGRLPTLRAHGAEAPDDRPPQPDGRLEDASESCVPERSPSGSSGSAGWGPGRPGSSGSKGLEATSSGWSAIWG